VGEYGDFAIIMAVVLFDAVLGYFQERQAQQTYTALKGLLKPTTTVIRDGARQEVEVWELVPGDLVLLNAGEKVPGDGELLESAKLAVDEAILTGESEPVNKSAMPGESSPEPQNLVEMGSTVITGRGILRVTQTGTRTELGKIAASLQEHVEADTPLQVRMKVFSQTLTRIVLLFTLAILVAGLLMGRGFLDMLRTSIILAIAAVPEGLLIAVTVILVLGMRKILKREGLVKKMLAVETLGSVTTICTDKTGTLTEGRMRVTRTDFNDPQRALETTILCNNLEGPVDIALWEYAQAQVNGAAQDLFDGSERLAEELFSSETKYMWSNLLQRRAQPLPERRAEITGDAGDEAERRPSSQVDAWAGSWTAGFAYRRMACTKITEASPGSAAGWRPNPKGCWSSPDAHRADRVQMITGDTGGLPSASGATSACSGRHEILEAGAGPVERAGVPAAGGSTAIFARIRPQDKLRIVKALQARREVTAMIGDGVNDAPALKRADIGVVVGTATDVARETADLILLDNNFRTVVAAVEEGRTIFQNIRKVVAYTLSNSFAEVLTIFISMLLRWPAPLAVAQILWIHLICDGPSDIVLGFEPKEEGIMDEKPKPVTAPVLTRLGMSLIGVISATSAIVRAVVFGHYYQIHNNRPRAEPGIRQLRSKLDGVHLRLPQHAPAAVADEPAEPEPAADLGGAGRAGYGGGPLLCTSAARPAGDRAAEPGPVGADRGDRAGIAGGGGDRESDQQPDPQR
jgi:Ca2+-transporting ATPase